MQKLMIRRSLESCSYLSEPFYMCFFAKGHFLYVPKDDCAQFCKVPKESSLLIPPSKNLTFNIHLASVEKMDYISRSKQKCNYSTVQDIQIYYNVDMLSEEFKLLFFPWRKRNGIWIAKLK